MPEYVCPNCKQADRLAEIDLIIGYARGSFDQEGQFIFDGETKVDWDSQAPVPEGERYICLLCNEKFSKPAVKRHPENEEPT